MNMQHTLPFSNYVTEQLQFLSTLTNFQIFRTWLSPVLWTKMQDSRFSWASNSCQPQSQKIWLRQLLSDIREDFLISLFCIFLWYLVNILGASRDSLVLIYMPDLQDGNSMKTKHMKIHTKASTLYMWKWLKRNRKIILPLQAWQ